MAEKNLTSIAEIPDTDPQNIDEAKMMINVLKKSYAEKNDELQKTYKELATSREQANVNFKKLLSMTQPSQSVGGQVEVEADFSKIKL
jgi:uncharacterized protein YfbU (UPF0304 family)